MFSVELDATEYLMLFKDAGELWVGRDEVGAGLTTVKLWLEKSVCWADI